MVVSPTREPVSATVGRFIGWSTRLLCLAAVATQTVLLAIELGWVVRHHAPIGQVGGQFGLFAATVVLAGLVFRLTAPLRPADPRQRLARSEALRLAAVRPHHCGWDGLPGRCAGQRRPAV
jgi:hypothetical protein